MSAQVWHDADILYTGSVFPPADSMPNLKWIQSHAAGVDTLLKQPLIQNNDEVIITSTRGIHATHIAEYVLGAFLMFGHQFLPMIRDQRQKEWSKDRGTRFVPFELRDATVGIVGYGAIGREVARLCKAFGATVLASKRDVKDLEADDHYSIEGTGDPEGTCFDRLYPPQALATMVKDCDFVVITTPLTEKTRNLYSEKVIKAMKPQSYLVNIGRGGVVDEQALLEALKSGHVSGAMMDVFEQEPLPEDSPLWTAPNLIITPHIAGVTRHYNEKAAAVFEENLRRYIENKSLINQVDRSEGY
jgi:phosphoglycerate dehydrogenase-like enzyme